MLSKPYSSLLRLLVFYLFGIVAVAIILEWSVLGAWTLFLGLTALVFSLSYRSIFPASARQLSVQEFGGEAKITRMMRELEASVRKGFQDQNHSAQRKTFDELERVYAQKVKRRLGLDDAKLRDLLQNPEKLETILGDIELVQLIRGNIMMERESWDLSTLSSLLRKVELWG